MLFQEKQKSSQRKIHKSFAKQFIEIPLKVISITFNPLTPLLPLHLIDMDETYSITLFSSLSILENNRAA